LNRNPKEARKEVAKIYKEEQLGLLGEVQSPQGRCMLKVLAIQSWSDRSRVE
jgi:hypothetical protein